MNLPNWIIGPQLIGFILLLVGLMQVYFPPKKINNLYGYRTSSSMKNQQMWDEANRYSARYTVWVGLIILLIGIAITAALKIIMLPIKIKIALDVLAIIAPGLISMAIVIAMTERHLEKFEKNK